MVALVAAAALGRTHRAEACGFICCAKKPVAQARTLAGKTRMNNSLPKLYDVGEIAQYLRISERTVQRLI